MKDHVALTRCYYCGESNEILLCTRYRRIPGGRSDQMEPVTDMAKFNGQVVSEHPCPKCKGYMKQGIILISVRPPTAPNEEPYRTGGFWVVREEAAKRVFKDVDLSKRCAFIPNEVAMLLGLPDTDKLVP